MTELPHPTKVSFVLTELCNMRCRHCYAWKARDGRVLPTDVIVRSLDELGRWAGPYTLFLTGGEPTLHRGLVPVIEAAASRGGFVSMASNGSRIDEALARELVAAGLGHIDVSLDAMTPEVHDRFRGRVGSHERAVRAVRLVDEARRELGRSIYINVQATISSANIGELPALARWVADEGFGQLLLQPIAPPFWSRYDRAWLMRSDLWPRDTAAVQAMLDEIIDLKRQGLPIDNSVEHLEGMRDYFGWAPPEGDETLVDEDLAGDAGEPRPLDDDHLADLRELRVTRGRRPSLDDGDDEARLDAKYFAERDAAGELGPKRLFDALDIEQLPSDVRPERIDRCSIGLKVLNINHIGDVRLCHDMPPIGNLAHASLYEIWTSRRAALVRELIAHCHEGCYLLNCNFCD